MIRSLILAFALSTPFVAIGSGPVFAQTTDQTDQSEEDWRKSRKKRDTTDIFEDIKNSRNTGWGITQGPISPVDSLPEESRRHLMRERARIIANTSPGTPVETEYKPSEAAKTDPDLQSQEKEAWDVIVTDLKGGGQGSSPSGQDGPNKIAVTGQGGGQGDSDRGNSTMRGGSTQSVAEILAQIKGMQSAGGTGSPSSMSTGNRTSQAPIGSNQPSRASDGQAQQGQESANSSSQTQGDQEQQTQSEAQGVQAQDGGQSQNNSDQNATNDAPANPSSEAQAPPDKVAADAQAQSQAQKQPETISPLERIKNRRDRDSGGQRTSASDFLKKSE